MIETLEERAIRIARQRDPFVDKTKYIGKLKSGIASATKDRRENNKLRFK